MGRTQVVVIGGGATGTGIVRDLSMRGIAAILIEQADLASGTSSRFHGLLHSGARYAVNDPDAARECIEENTILRRIGKSCVEETEGWFVRTPEDDPAFEPLWVEACRKCGIETRQVSVAEALRREPNLTRDALAAYRVPDSAVDGFRLVWHNVMSAKRYGGKIHTYCRVTGIETANGAVRGVHVLHTKTGQPEFIECDYVINASGSWAGEVAHLAGIDVNVSPDRGTLLAFNHRFTSRVINRLRKSTDGDIFVPHGSIVIFGTTSVPTDRPDDTRPRSEEVVELLRIGKALFPRIEDYRMLRAFAGTRPLYSPDASTGRSATRNFVVIDHEREGLKGMLSITGGKFTSFRLMAEKACDVAARHLGVTAPCRTAEEAIIPDPDETLTRRTRSIFPSGASQLAVSRLGDDLENAVATAEKDPWKKLLLCECEFVTMAEFETVANEPTSHSLGDIRRRTRLGMGTCQGSFCALRATGVLAEASLLRDRMPRELFRQFIEERWHGIRPLLWGNQIREIELERGIYCATLNIDGESCSMEPPAAGSCSPAATVQDAEPAKPVATPSTPVSATEEYDVIVVGSGFAGLTAAATAASRGKKTLVLTYGAGALTIGGGTIDLLGYTQEGPVMGDPFAAMQRLPQTHPYRLVGERGILDSLAFLSGLAAENGQATLQAGCRDRGNAWLPTATGTMKPVWMTAAGMDPAILHDSSSFTVLGVLGMKDFSAHMAALGLGACASFKGKTVGHASVSCPLLGDMGPVRDITALDLARFVDTPEGRAWLFDAVAKVSGNPDAVLIPSILGTKPGGKLHEDMEKATGRKVLELFCPPPSVTGLRMQGILMKALRARGVAFVENAFVQEAITENGRCLALKTHLPDAVREYRAKSFIIATGGLFSKGIVTRPGAAHESIFRLPITMPEKQDDWALDTFFTQRSHPFATMGVTGNERLNPVDGNGKVLFENVHFAGRTLGGYDFALEKSGSGVALATGHYAGTLV